MMNYTEIMDAVEPRFAEQVRSGKGGAIELARIRKAREYEAAGIVMPDSLRAWLRKLVEIEETPPCARLTKRDQCEWLSRREPIGESVGCPFYQRAEDPRGCDHYRPSDDHQRIGENKTGVLK
jgi:hypothetical protein